MKLSRDEMLLEMGLGPLWKLRRPPLSPEAVPADVRPGAASASVEEGGPTAAPAAIEQAPCAPAPLVEANEAESWDALRREVAGCRACGLCEQRQQAVLGVGDVHADWLFIGEGPGAEEDRRGEPFVGPAGKLLDAMLAAIDLKRGEDVYIANAVKCRPPNNRTPTAAEIATCRPYLERQVALLQPRLVFVLGKPAVQATLGLDAPLGSLRGRTHFWEVAGRRIPVVISYHPAYLLRTPLDKARAWEDLCRARALMREAKGA